MSNDLISRKEALNLIRSIAESRNLSTFECYLYGDIYDGIKNIETAYDVDAVCKELEKMKNISKENISNNGIKLFSVFCSNAEKNVLEKAIEIVRNGGKKE